jgi:hypothetical protein
MRHESPDGFGSRIQAEADAVLEAAVEYAESVGWEVSAVTGNPDSYRASEEMGPGQARLTCGLGLEGVDPEPRSIFTFSLSFADVPPLGNRSVPN